MWRLSLRSADGVSRQAHGVAGVRGSRGRRAVAAEGVLQSAEAPGLFLSSFGFAPSPGKRVRAEQCVDRLALGHLGYPAGIERGSVPRGLGVRSA